MTTPRNGDKVTIQATSGNIADVVPGRFLPREPREVAWSPWWASRLRDGDITIVVSPVAPSAPAPTPTPSDEA